MKFIQPYPIYIFCFNEIACLLLFIFVFIFLDVYIQKLSRRAGKMHAQIHVLDFEQATTVSNLTFLPPQINELFHILDVFAQIKA